MLLRSGRTPLEFLDYYLHKIWTASDILGLVGIATGLILGKSGNQVSGPVLK